MKRFWVLYKKELKTLIKPFFVLFMIHVAGIVYLLVTDIPDYNIELSLFTSYVEYIQEHYAFLNIFMYGTVCLIPFLLAYSYFEDWSDKTSLQLLSLPTKRNTVAWSKYCAAMTVGLFVPIGILIYHYLYDIKINPHIGQPPQPFLYHVFFAFFTLCIISWIVSVVSVSAGVMTSVQKYHLVFGITAFVVLSAVSWGILHVITSPSLSFSQTAHSDTGVFYSGYTGVIRGIILILESIFIMLIGQFIFEKYVEV